MVILFSYELFLEPFTDFLPISDELIIFEPSIGSEDVRRRCFSTMFFPDRVDDNIRSYAFDLTLDASTSGGRVNPDVTEIFVIDQEGK